MTNREANLNPIREHSDRRHNAIGNPSPLLPKSSIQEAASSLSPRTSESKRVLRSESERKTPIRAAEFPGSSIEPAVLSARLSLSRVNSITITETKHSVKSSVSPSGSIQSFAEFKARKSSGSLASLKVKNKPMFLAKELSIKPEEDESLEDAAKLAMEEISQPKIYRRPSVVSSSSGKSSNDQMSSTELSSTMSSPMPPARRQSSLNHSNFSVAGTSRRSSLVASTGSSPSGSILSFSEAKARKSNSSIHALPMFKPELSVKPEVDEDIALKNSDVETTSYKAKAGNISQFRRSSILQAAVSTPPERAKRISLAGLQSKLASSRPSSSAKRKISSSTKALLQKLLACYKIGSRLQRYITNHMKGMLFKVRGEIKPAAASGQPSLSAILTSLSQSPNAYIPTLIRNLLTAPIRDIAQIVTVLNQHVKDFNTFSKAEQLHLAKHLRYDIVSQDQVLLWEEHLATCFYFILTGQIEVFKNNNGKLLKLACMSKGAFGHGRIKVDLARRSAGAFSVGTSVVLTIERDDYLSLKVEEEDSRLFVLENLPIFKDCGDKLRRFFKVHEYPPGALVQKEGDLVNRIFWVLEGQLKVIQAIAIIKKEGAITTERAWKEGVVLNENESKVMVDLETAKIAFGNWFNNLSPCGENKGTVKYLGAEYINKKAFVDYYSTTNDDPAMASSYTVISDGKSVLASLAMEELCDFLSKESIYNLTFKHDVVVYSMAELQERYLADQAWEALKAENIKKGAKKKM